MSGVQLRTRRTEHGQVSRVRSCVVVAASAAR
jgi:hypothetical protein